MKWSSCAFFTSNDCNTMEERVRKNTAAAVNRSVDEQIIESIALYSEKDQNAITQRIQQLEKEWDIERALDVNMPIVALTGIALGLLVDRWWFVFPVIVLLFFLQHAIQGWCPPLPIFRRLGYRTKKEIEQERYSLKYLRGDFAQLTKSEEPSPFDIFKAVGKS